MGRWSGGGKDTTEGYKTITTKFLKDHNELAEIRNGSINWTRNGERTGSVSFDVSIVPGDEYIRFYYTSTDRSTEEKTDYNYKVSLVTSRCNYGGVRYWFICPLVQDGVACNRRVGVLYMGSKYFGCRHCYNLTYESRNESRSGLFGAFNNVFKAGKIYDSMKRTFYNGKPTKKMRRWMTLQGKMPSKAELDLMTKSRVG